MHETESPSPERVLRRAEYEYRAREKKRVDRTIGSHADRSAAHSVPYNHIVFIVITRRPFNRRLGATLFSHFARRQDYTNAGRRGEGKGGGAERAPVLRGAA